MFKIGSSLIVLTLAGAFSLAITTPTFAKAKVKTKPHGVTSSYSHVVRTPGPPIAPVVRCREGVWDRYGLRCDDASGSK